jgi:hypothetical protein
MSGNSWHKDISVKGLTFRREQDFKTWWMKFVRESSLFPPRAIFEIETEEKEPGFPDVLLIDSEGYAIFYETKVAYKGGRFEFEPTQPKFYRAHPNLAIYVVVLDKEKDMVHMVTAAQAAQEALDNQSLILNIRKF